MLVYLKNCGFSSGKAQYTEKYVEIKNENNVRFGIDWRVFYLEEHCDIIENYWPYKKDDKNIFYRDGGITVFKEKPKLISFNINISLS